MSVLGKLSTMVPMRGARNLRCIMKIILKDRQTYTQPLQTIFSLGVFRCNGHIIEYTKPVGGISLAVVSGRPAINRKWLLNHQINWRTPRTFVKPSPVITLLEPFHYVLSPTSQHPQDSALPQQPTWHSDKWSEEKQWTGFKLTVPLTLHWSGLTLCGSSAAFTF